jgi:hypothetical protein
LSPARNTLNTYGWLFVCPDDACQTCRLHPAANHPGRFQLQRDKMPTDAVREKDFSNNIDHEFSNLNDCQCRLSGPRVLVDEHPVGTAVAGIAVGLKVAKANLIRVVTLSANRVVTFCIILKKILSLEAKMQHFIAGGIRTAIEISWRWSSVGAPVLPVSRSSDCSWRRHPESRR